ncbi:MAG: 50S ribosomal protein L1 [Phycisphaerales bacterium]|nr:50S ribosomal protein L1 [Phycisphaerales bacterium]
MSEATTQSTYPGRLYRRRKNTRSKRHTSNIAKTNVAGSALEPREAVALLKSYSKAKFDETIDCCMHLGIDPRQADQQLRGALSMPKGIGKSSRVICFCSSDKEDEMRAAGAIEVGGEELAKKITDGWFDFDVAIASPDMMRVVGGLGRVLGPKGLMPSPKAGTVTPDAVTAVKEFAAGKTEYRNDDGGNIHCTIGKMSFSEDDLFANLTFFLNTIENIRPASVKGTYVKKCVITGTMTPSVEVAAS